VPTKPCRTQRDLSLAYTPGVAVPCLDIKDDPGNAFRYTGKGNLIAVVSNGTAVLALGTSASYSIARTLYSSGTHAVGGPQRSWPALTSSCRRHDADPQLYFMQLLVNLPSWPASDLDAWLPDRWKQTHAARCAALGIPAPPTT
jgi:hypothetical protein